MSEREWNRSLDDEVMEELTARLALKRCELDEAAHRRWLAERIAGLTERDIDGLRTKLNMAVALRDSAPMARRGIAEILLGSTDSKEGP
jgi:hypothetical protein